MAEATLNEVSQKLSSQLKVDEVIARGVNGLRDEFQKLYGLQEKLLRQMAEAAREGKGGGEGGGEGAAAAKEDPAKSMSPFMKLAIVAAVAVFTAVKDYFSKLSKTLKLLFKGVSKVFKGFLRVSKIGEYASDIAKSVKGSIKAVFAVMGKALKSLVPDLDPIKDSFKSVKAYFRRIRTAFSSGADDFLKFLTENSIFKTLKKGFTSIKNFLFGSFQGDDVKGIKSFASGIMQRVSDFFKPIRTFFSAEGPIGKIAKVIMKPFAFLKAGSGFMKILVGVGRVIGRLAWPITVIMGLIDGISGFFEAFGVTEGSGIKKFAVGLLGGFAGVVSGIFGVIPDLLKEVVSFLAGLFGFDQVKEVLDGFSFTDMIKNIIMSPVVMLKRALNAIIEGIATTIENLEVSVLGKTVGIPGRDKLAESLRGMKFDTEGDEAYTEKVARKKQEDKEAGEALDRYDEESGLSKQKYKNLDFAKKVAKPGEEIVQDSEGNYRLRKKKGPTELKSGQLSGKAGKFVDGDALAPVPATAPSGAPIFINDNSSQVNGGGTTLAGETRPSTANGQAEKTGFYRSSGGF